MPSFVPAEPSGLGSDASPVRGIGRLRASTAILLVLLAGETLALSLKAGVKLLWYDELLTYYVSGLGRPGRIWQALYEGADGMPPGYYLVVLLARQLPVDPAVAVRLPSIAGYLLALCGISWFIRRRLGGVAAVASVLVVALSPFRAYAIEARSYALLVGFLALAAVLWQRIGERPRMVPLFGLALAAAVACHYLAVVSIGLFVLAELAWTLWSRRWRTAVWVACACATAPFLASLPIILHFRTIFGAHFWARPAWGTVVSTYQPYLWGGPTALGLTLLYLGLLPFLLRPLWRRRSADTAPATELVLVAGFVLYPAALAALARIAGSGYVFRYGWPVIFGLAVAAANLFRQFWRRGFAVVLPGVLLMAVAGRDVTDLRLTGQAPDVRIDQNWVRLSTVCHQNEPLPIVVSPGLLFLKSIQYAPADLRSRLAYLFDPAAAVRFSGTDTLDKANRILSHFVPLRVEDRAEFLQETPRFLLATVPDSQDWIGPFLRDRNYRLRTLAREVDLTLVLVEQ